MDSRAEEVKYDLPCWGGWGEKQPPNSSAHRRCSTHLIQSDFRQHQRPSSSRRGDRCVESELTDAALVLAFIIIASAGLATVHCSLCTRYKGLSISCWLWKSQLHSCCYLFPLSLFLTVLLLSLNWQWYLCKHSVNIHIYVPYMLLSCVPILFICITMLSLNDNNRNLNW